MHKIRKDREDGFTLIELIIVVVILGILTAVAIPSYGAIQRTSEKRSMTVAGQSAAKDLQLAMPLPEARPGTKTEGPSRRGQRQTEVLRRTRRGSTNRRLQSGCTSMTRAATAMECFAPSRRRKPATGGSTGS